MTMNVSGYAALSASAPLVPFQFARRDARPDDVVIEILFCGVCHSDLHSVRNDWGGARYPMVPGHEIVGRVVSVGAEVTRFAPGDHVGVGCLVDACQRCPACDRGEENYCKEGVLTYNGVDRRDQQPTYGGYADRIVV
ncbi:MAG: alcohol dehydrogenase catalytic domain-containing protein, partial [Proteobacteria bacterium]|nr:alcohol dehydrogenase catalytic domain-containing protein [Pseudomonadota bacterium]